MGFFTQGEAHTRSFIKAVSWRATGSVDTFVISLFITGKFGLAGAIASVEVITKIILYYLHERAWAIIPWGKMTLVAHRLFGLRALECRSIPATAWLASAT
jgi:uncharacterized membrane protein